MYFSSIDLFLNNEAILPHIIYVLRIRYRSGSQAILPIWKLGINKKI